MKLRILAAPILIILIIMVAIWYVNPAFQDLRIKKAALGAAQTKLEDVREKNRRAGELRENLATKTDQNGALLQYIPAQQKEEEVIANLNALAGAAGLAVYNISIGDIEKKEKVAEDPMVQMGDSLLASNAPAVAVQPKPETKNFKVELGVIGSYGKIKELLGKIAALQRFNSIDSLKITKVKEQVAAADSGTSDNLQADISLNFNFIDKNNAIVNLDNEIFANGNFDMSVVDEIKSQMTTVVNSLSVGTNGVQNPFVR